MVVIQTRLSETASTVGVYVRLLRYRFYPGLSPPPPNLPLACRAARARRGFRHRPIALAQALLAVRRPRQGDETSRRPPRPAASCGRRRGPDEHCPRGAAASPSVLLRLLRQCRARAGRTELLSVVSELLPTSSRARWPAVHPPGSRPAPGSGGRRRCRRAACPMTAAVAAPSPSCTSTRP